MYQDGVALAVVEVGGLLLTFSDWRERGRAGRAWLPWADQGFGGGAAGNVLQEWRRDAWTRARYRR